MAEYEDLLKFGLIFCEHIIYGVVSPWIKFFMIFWHYLIEFWDFLLKYIAAAKNMLGWFLVPGVRYLYQRTRYRMPRRMPILLNFVWVCLYLFLVCQLF